MVSVHLYDLNIALYRHFIKRTCNKNKKPWDDRIHTDGGKNSQFTSANSLCSSSSNYLLADPNLHPYPYFQTDNSFPELELHKPFVPLLIFVGKIVSFFFHLYESADNLAARCHVPNCLMLVSTNVQSKNIFSNSIMF